MVQHSVDEVHFNRRQEDHRIISLEQKIQHLESQIETLLASKETGLSNIETELKKVIQQQQEVLTLTDTVKSNREMIVKLSPLADFVQKYESLQNVSWFSNFLFKAVRWFVGCCFAVLSLYFAYKATKL